MPLPTSIDVLADYEPSGMPHDGYLCVTHCTPAMCARQHLSTITKDGIMAAHRRQKPSITMLLITQALQNYC